jgi:hypothetical protein
MEKFPLAKFKNLLLELEDLPYRHQPLFEVEKERTFNIRQKYYQRLIDHAAISFLNGFRNELCNAKTEEERQYIIDIALKNLTHYLLENYMRCTSYPNNLSESLVKLALKHELVRLYVEVSSEQNAKIGDGFIEEVYQRFYNESAPTPPMIHEASFVVAIPDSKPLIIHSNNDFHIHYADFRPDKKGILSYDTIIKNPKRFANFEKDLYLQGFIDQDYNFTHKHGLKNELAAVYHEMISKEYFSPRDFEKLKEIKPIDVRKFLDYRYQVNLDKQFRVLSNADISQSKHAMDFY